MGLYFLIDLLEGAWAEDSIWVNENAKNVEAHKGQIQFSSVLCMYFNVLYQV